MLNHLSMEAVELLKGKPIVKSTLNIFRWMSPPRQVEVAKLMVSTGNFSRSFAQALLVATKPDDRVTTKSRPIWGLSDEQKVEMQRELESVLNDIGTLQSYGADVLCLVVASGYISKLLNEKKIENYLGQNYPEILEEFRTIVAHVPLSVRPSAITASSCRCREPAPRGGG